MSVSQLKQLNKDVLKDARIRGVIHNHPWTGQLTDLRFSYQIPLGNRKDITYDRDIIDDDENENISFYLYAPDGILWVNRGKNPDDPLDNGNRYDRIIAKFLPWDPEARETRDGAKPGPYNKHWQWTPEANQP